MIKKSPTNEASSIRITFTLPSAILAQRVSVVGDFNGWDARATPMRHDRSADQWTATVDLEPGQRYRFRYLVDGQEWLNDWCADDHVENCYGCYDSVVDLTRVEQLTSVEPPAH